MQTSGYTKEGINTVSSFGAYEDMKRVLEHVERVLAHAEINVEFIDVEPWYTNGGIRFSILIDGKEY